MQFSVVLFAASALAASLTVTDVAYSTDVQTITSCGPEVTNCPLTQQNQTAIPTYSAAANLAQGNFYAAGAAALAAGALLL
jgi:hypothetical protein